MTMTTWPHRKISVVPGVTNDGGDEMSQQLFFRANDIARMWTEERRRVGGPGEPPVQVPTVWRYIQRSRSKNGLYHNNPMPMPVYPGNNGDEHTPKRGQIPLWVPEEGESLKRLEQRIRAWWHSRPGAGSGGGRPWPDVQHPTAGNPGTPGTTRSGRAARGTNPRKGRDAR